MRIEPFLHVGLVLVFCRLIAEYVGDLAGLFVVAGGGWCMRWWGPTWDAEGVPVQAMLVGDVGRGPGEMGS